MQISSDNAKLEGMKISPETAISDAAAAVDMVALSVVVPVADEAGNIVPQIEEICAALDGGAPYEIIYVDDASVDGTVAELQDANARFPVLRTITHNGRSGQSAAITTGFWRRVRR